MKKDDKTLSRVLLLIGIICAFVLIVLIAFNSEEKRYDAHIVARNEDFKY